MSKLLSLNSPKASGREGMINPVQVIPTSIAGKPVIVRHYVPFALEPEIEAVDDPHEG